MTAGASVMSIESLPLEAFAARHVEALEEDEVRHNIILSTLARPPANLRTWTLGEPGQCAIQFPGRPMVLGELDSAQCRELAEATRDLDYQGVVGPAPIVGTFVEHATALGYAFAPPMPQMIHVLDEAPTWPNAPGRPRFVDMHDAERLIEWTLAFCKEAVPHDPPPNEDNIRTAAGSGRYMFWTVDDEPVAMAAIVRRTRNAAAIAVVYTPPALRGRGYAGSVTAAVAELAAAQGQPIACLYTDLRNPASNRCYAKIGFRPHCASAFYLRQRSI